MTEEPTPTGGVSTYAGNGTAGLQNGPAAQAEFDLPTDIALDAQGNLYISEQGTNVIRKISGGGQVSTYAGDGTAGYKDDDAAANAEFNQPEGLVLDGAGNLYVADAGNNVIRKITPQGKVSTYAGTGVLGHANGASNIATFAHPNGLAIDKSRNIYVADAGNNLIRRISSNGSTVSTYAGTGAAGFTNATPDASAFNGPAGLAIDPSGNLYVADIGNNAIRLIPASGTVSTFAGNLHGPARVAIDIQGSLYVSANTNIIQKIASDGTTSTYAGDGTPGFKDGALLSAQFSTPLGLLVDPSGNIALVDYFNNRIRLIAP